MEIHTFFIFIPDNCSTMFESILPKKISSWIFSPKKQKKQVLRNPQFCTFLLLKISRNFFFFFCKIDLSMNSGRRREGDS